MHLYLNKGIEHHFHIESYDNYFVVNLVHNENIYEFKVSVEFNFLNGNNYTVEYLHERGHGMMGGDLENIIWNILLPYIRESRINEIQ